MLLRWPQSSAAGAAVAGTSAVDCARVGRGAGAPAESVLGAFARVFDAACAVSYRAARIARWASSLLMESRVEDGDMYPACIPQAVPVSWTARCPATGRSVSTRRSS